MSSRVRVALIGSAVLAVIVLTAYVQHRPTQPQGTPAVETAGSAPGWRFARSDPPGRLTLIYQFPGSRMQFVGACHQGPAFFYFREDVNGVAAIARIDGVEVPLARGGGHGGIFFDEGADSIARIAEAKQSIELVAGKQSRSFKPVPDIAAFVTECRRLISDRS